jgi:hypothetical protein
MSTARAAVLWDWLLPPHLESAHPEPLRVQMAHLLETSDGLARRGRDDSTRQAAVLGAGDLREAVFVVARAAALGEGAPEHADLVAFVHRRLHDGRPPDIDDGVVIAAMRGSPPAYFDALSNEALVLARESLESTARWLRESLDVRSTAYLRGARMGRIAALALGIVALIVEILAARLALDDVALHKPVSGNGLRGEAGEGLVDGIKDGVVGVQTETTDRPWVQIDLGAVFDVRRVVVYNRGDRNLNDGLPYDLETSEDATTYTPISHRGEAFGDGSLGAPPWTSKTKIHARYVRLRAHSYIALSEVEVFGRPYKSP